MKKCFFLIIVSIFIMPALAFPGQKEPTTGITITTSDGPAEIIKIIKTNKYKLEGLGDPGGRPLKEFSMTVSNLTIEVAPGVFNDVWAYGFLGQKPSVPGPEIRVKEGDFVRVYFYNSHFMPHTIHFHGINAPYHSDGVPDFSQDAVETDEIFIYEFIARRPGTHFYHCHVDTLTHLDMGMYGAIIVEPKEGEEKVDRDIVWFLDEWSIIPDGKEWYELPGAGTNGKYNYFTINSVSWPILTSAITNIKEGEKIRIRLINVGYKTHSIHFHGHKTYVTHYDGYPVKDPYLIDTISISASQRIDILFTADNPGVFPVHCHILPHITNNGKYPGGMLSAIIYEGFNVGDAMKNVEDYSKRHLR